MSAQRTLLLQRQVFGRGVQSDAVGHHEMFFRGFAGMKGLFVVRRRDLVHEIRSHERWVTRAAIGEQESDWNTDLLAPPIEQEAEIGVTVKNDLWPVLPNLPG